MLEFHIVIKNIVVGTISFSLSIIRYLNSCSLAVAER